MTAASTALAIRSDWTAEEKDTIKRTCAPEATEPELAMFFHVARVSGLDPLQRQIWFMKRWQKRRDADDEVLTDPHTGKVLWESKVSIMAGADGLQARALRFPDCKGIRYAAVHDKDVFLVDRATGIVKKHWSNPFKAGECVGAWACVEREGKAPFFVVVHMHEYRDKNGPLWKTKPVTMIEKVARATALRRAYPENFAGIYDEAEIDEGDGKPELDVTPAAQSMAAAPSNVAKLPPSERRPAVEPSQPRVDLDPAETRARAAAITTAAEKVQRERDGREIRDIETRAKAIAKGVSSERYREFCQEVLKRQIPNESGWNHGLSDAERDDIAAAVEQLPSAPVQPKPSRANGRRAPSENPPPKKLVPNGDGTIVPA